MKGLSATKELKRISKTQDIPILALTSFTLQGDEEKARNSGCSGYITKPIDTRKFMKYIEKFLE